MYIGRDRKKTKSPQQWGVILLWIHLKYIMYFIFSELVRFHLRLQFKIVNYMITFSILRTLPYTWRGRFLARKKWNLDAFSILISHTWRRRLLAQVYIILWRIFNCTTWKRNKVIFYLELCIKSVLVKVEIFLEQREVAFLSPSKICKNLNFSTVHI